MLAYMLPTQPTETPTHLGTPHPGGKAVTLHRPKRRKMGTGATDPQRMKWVAVQVEDGVCVPGLSIKQIASTADVEAVMDSASAQQHSAASHLVLSVYVACKERTTGDSPSYSPMSNHPW